MNKATAKDVLKVEAAAGVILVEALKAVADANGRTLEEAVTAYKLGVPNVVKNVEDLALAAATELADRINEGLAN